MPQWYQLSSNQVFECLGEGTVQYGRKLSTVAVYPKQQLSCRGQGFHVMIYFNKTYHNYEVSTEKLK